MKNLSKTLLSILLCTFIFAGCSAKKSSNPSIALFIPGNATPESPVYLMLKEGVTAAVEAFNTDKADSEKAELYVMEAGTNQAEWSPKLTALAAAGKYDVIISSNPSLPDLAVPILKQFPKQKFILLDATLKDNQNIFTACYNQYEQSYLSGLIAGYMSKSHKVALVAAQEYPVMNNVLFPYFEKGAKDAYADTTVDFRVVGNWYDANKGSMLADALIKNGTDVILPICGGAAQGVINSAVNSGTYITWFDNNGFNRAPGTVISSAVVKQYEMANIATSDYLAGKTKWGAAETYGIRQGFVDFIEDDPLYAQTVPADIREKMNKVLSDIRSGTFVVNPQN